MILKIIPVLFVALVHFSGSEGIQCYKGTGSSQSPVDLSKVECAEGVVNCLKMVSSNEDGSEVDYEYQCGSNAAKANTCAKQDPSQPFPLDDDGDMDAFMDKEMEDLVKDAEEQDAAIKDATDKNDEDIKVHPFPLNAKISKKTIRKGETVASREEGWSERVEESVRRIKRDATDEAESANMFCYCDEDLCNGSTSFSGFGATSLTIMAAALSHFY